jgi:protein translocase SecG subunit
MFLTIVQIIVSILLIISILLQAPGTGLSPVFGAGGEAFRTKQSAQRFLIIMTVVLASLLAILSVIQLLLHRG